MKVTITATGPLFDGRANRQVKQAEQDWGKGIATLGASMVRTELNAVLRHQTPHYRIQIEAREEPPGWKISDGGVIYGPWLEGIGSRNRTTRFKGYATFRRMVQRINARAETIGQPIVARFVARMNG